VNLGDYPNRNKAASYAKGKYIKYVDADDMIYPWGLEIMVSCMEKFPLAGFGLSSKQINEKIFPVCLSPREIYLEHYAGYYHFDRAPGSSIILTDVFNSIGGFSGKRLIGDYEFWFKISRVYPMVKLPVDMYWNRIHLGQESKSLSALDYQMLRCNIEKEALKDPLCPLTKKEIDRIKIRQFKNTLRQYIKF
jgi:glycosyltransferase involved in cell wall biosynthesis